VSARLCLVTTEVLGPHRTGGIGTFLAALADLLVSEGHAVTVLCLNGRRCLDGPFEAWIDHYRRRDITLVPLPDANGPPPGGVWQWGTLGRRLRVLSWLQAHSFDLIHFNDWGGDAALCGQAKALGLAFEKTPLVLGLHGASDWSMSTNDTPLSDPARLIQMELERAAPPLMDAVWSPSRFMMDRLPRTGVLLPPSGGRILPVLLPAAGSPRPANAETAPLREVVLFGRLEARKGLAWVLDGLDRLAADHPPERHPARVTFLGRAGILDGAPADRIIRRRARAWPWTTTVLDRLNRTTALDYLRQPGRLALIAGIDDNSPLTLHECLALRIPVLARSGGGVPEAVAPKDHDRLLIPPTADAAALAARLAVTVGTTPKPGHPRMTQADARTLWRDWHIALLAPASSRPTSPPTPHPRPLVPPVHPLVAPADHPEPAWSAALTDVPAGHAAWLLTDADRPDPGTGDRVSSLLIRCGADLLAPGWREGPEARIVLCLDAAPASAQIVNLVAGPGLLVGPRAVAVAARDWTPESGLWGLVAVCRAAGLTHRAVPTPLLSREPPWIDPVSALARAPTLWAAVDSGRSAPALAGLLAGMIARQTGTYRLSIDVGASPAARAEARARRRVRALWRSWGWRITRPLRNRTRRRAGLPLESADPPPMTEPWAAGDVLWDMLRSHSWSMVAMPRVFILPFMRVLHVWARPIRTAWCRMALGGPLWDRVPSPPSPLTDRRQERP